MVMMNLKAYIVIIISLLLQGLQMRSSSAFLPQQQQVRPIFITTPTITNSPISTISTRWNNKNRPSWIGYTSKTSRMNRRYQLSLSSSGGGNDATADITRSLARFDKLWKLQQTSKSRSRWTKLILQNDDDDGDNKSKKREENVRDDVDPSTSGIGSEEKEYVYLLEPPNFSSPSCIIVFIGGAGLGSFPQVAYQEFLIRISDKMNAAIITPPYGILGLDHFQLAKTVGEKSRRALLQCEDDPERMYNANLPVYCLAHSLGCKLASIYVAATGQEYDGMGFIGYNNYGFGKTISMAKEFARSIQESTTTTTRDPTTTTTTGTSDTFNQVFSMAQSLLDTLGVDFTPSREDTERLISMKFDSDRIQKVRLFVLDDDTLDDSESFLRSCESKEQIPQLCAIPGNHLSPVFFEFDLNNIDLPDNAREIAQSNLGGFESASFGNRQDLDELVHEVSNFLLNREPSRRPNLPYLLSSSSD